MEQDVTRRHFGMLAAGAAALYSAGIAGPVEAAPMGGDWLAMIKAQHKEIDRRLMAVKTAPTHAARLAAFNAFATYLSAHSMAEEVSVYPALAISGSRAAAKELYNEQDDAKILVARIDDALTMGHDAQVPPLLDQLASALHAHVAEEENEKFPMLQAHVNAAMNAKLTHDFRQAFDRAAS